MGRTWLCVFAGLAGLAGWPAPAPAEEVNPVRPKAARRLADRAFCRARALDVARALRPTGKTAVYDGDAGVAIFLARTGVFAARAEEYAARAHAAGDTGRGLYTGRDGVGEACLEVWRATGRKEWLDRARGCVTPGQPYAVTDVISGAAGTGIFLLNLHAATRDAAVLAEARRAGDFLARSARPGDGGWPISTRSPAVYVGFSHGAAGIGYFLHHLARRTGEDSYAQLARRAARFVVAHAEDEGGDGYHWWRTVPPQRDEARRVQWCHGAPGTGLFFLALGQDGPLDRCLNTTRRLGRTARRSGCLCHGVAGNADLLLEAYRVRRDKALLAEARNFASALLEPDPGGGYRVRTRGYGSSYMTGLAGIGQFLLRLADGGKSPMPLMVREAPTKR